MAFNTAPGRAEYTASAAQTKFTFSFKIFSTSDVKVYLTPVGQTADDTADLLIDTIDYNITINGDDGGDVNLTSGASLSDSITLVRELPTTRTTEYQQNGDLTAASLNEDQDYQTYLILDGATVSERALTVPDSVQSFDTEIPSPVASKLLLFNGDASGFDLLDPSGTGLFKDSFIVDNIAALGGVDPNVYNSVIARGYWEANDGGGGLFNYDSSQSAINNGGTIIDGWVRQIDGVVNAKAFGAKGDDTTDDTLAISGFLSIGGGLMDDGTYLIDEIVISNKVNVFGSNFRLKRRTAINGASNLILLTSGAEDSTWVGGFIDGNRASLKTEYDSFSAPIWQEFFVNCERVRLENITFENAIYMGLITDGAHYLKVINIISNNCVNNQIFRSDYVELNGFVSNDAHNLGSFTFIRGLLINTVTRSRFTNISINRCSGDAPNASGTDATTGFVCLDVHNCNISNVRVLNMEGEVSHLAISMVSCNNNKLSDFEATDFAGVGIELLSCDGSTLDGFRVDAQYHENAAGSDGSNFGLVVHESTFYPIGNRDRISVKNAQSVTVSNGLVLRCGVGVNVRSGNVRYSNVVVSGSLSQAWKFEEYTLTSGFFNKPSSPDNVTLIDCEASYSGLEGISLRGGDNIKIIGGKYLNNGQDTTGASIQRAGIGYPTSADMSNLLIDRAIISDEQVFARIDKMTFEPSTTTQDFPNNDLYTKVVTIIDYQGLNLGQHVELVNATTSGTVTGIVLDAVRDEITIGFTTAKTFTSSGNTIALTGIWSGSDTQLTGVGTLASTELPGAYFITDGTEWRQVMNVESDTIINIDSPFTTPLSSTTINILAITYNGVPSQQYGIRLIAPNISNLIHTGSIMYGNIIADSSIGSIPELTGTGLSISEAYRSKFIFVADDDVVSFIPISSAGMLTIGDGVDTIGSIVFRATSSPSISLGGSSGNVTTATGVLTGTTGSDGTLNLSVATDGKIYIENRLGGARTFQLLFVV